MFCVNTPQPYTHTFSLSSPVITKRSQTLQIQRCKRSGTKSPTIRERRSERDRERYRAAVHHSIATEAQGRYSLVRLRGECTSRLKLLASSKPFTLTDALALVFHTCVNRRSLSTFINTTNKIDACLFLLLTSRF